MTLTEYLNQVKSRLENPHGQDLQCRYDITKLIKVVEVLKDALEQLELGKTWREDTVQVYPIARHALSEAERLVGE
jgi:hypothetical protein